MAASMGGAFHSGEDFERGRVRHVQQEERLDGVEPTDAREDEPDERAPHGMSLEKTSTAAQIRRFGGNLLALSSSPSSALWSSWSTET